MHSPSAAPEAPTQSAVESGTPFFTIIIPVKAINPYVRETVPHILALADSSWELFIVPNEAEPNEWDDPRINILPSGRVSPGIKRDLAAKSAAGEVLVFLDDDSYPEKGLLDVARQAFADPRVVAAGGPAQTPPSDSFWQRVSGAVFLSRFAGGAPERYVPSGPVREVDDWPSVNLMVRKDDFLKVGGFDSAYWPGEDTKLCLDLIKKTGKKIVYRPDMLVWHHRRAGLAAHLRQVGGYGLHRGYFAKRYPETSLRAAYFAPSALLLFALWTLFGPALPEPFSGLIVFGWAAYGAALATAVYDMAKHEPLSVSLCAAAYAFLTHLVYGARFLQGLFTRKLVSRLR